MVWYCSKGGQVCHCPAHKRVCGAVWLGRLLGAWRGSSADVADARDAAAAVGVPQAKAC